MPNSPASNENPLLAGLTAPQQAAVVHGEGPLLILAGAGSGKTRVITRRVAYLLQSGVRAGSILAITFTNKAAGEMRHRVEQLVPGNKVFVSTFHSLGARLLRQYSDRLNIDRNFTIYDMDDRNKLITDAIGRAGIEAVKADRLGGVISKAKNALQTPSRFAEGASDFFSQTAAKVYAIYEKLLRAANGMDFDDLLYLPAMALRMNEEFRAELDARFKYILIDEYQDTNMAQYEIARRLSLHHPNICVVGDPDQSIYKWRGSDIRNILDFERDFPNARVITLEQNYRSTKSILAAASTLIDHNTQRKKKQLVTDNPEGEPVRILTFDTGLDEAEGVVMRIKASVKDGTHHYRDFAIFLRINALTRSLESAFIKHGVPFQIVKGLAFFERKENRDVLAYLRLLLNPNDTVSFLRIVNEPVRGIGKVSLERLVQHANDNELSLTVACGQVARIPDIRGKAQTGLRDFFRLMTDLRSKIDQPVPELIQLVLDQSGYRKMLKDSTDEEDSDRLANIEELISAAQQFHTEDPSRTLSDFLEQVALASDVDSMNTDSDCVSVMTMHSAKGLEFPVVYILAVEQGLLPHDRSMNKDEEIQEERRLFFVGITRAMRELNICHARLRDFRGQALYAVPSMFLDELPRDIERIDLSSSRHFSRSPQKPIPLPPMSPPPAASSTSFGGTEYTTGQLVQHSEYGIGQITEVNGFGALRRVKIRFAAAGEKTFVADKVILKVVPRKA